MQFFPLFSSGTESNSNVSPGTSSSLPESANELFESFFGRFLFDSQGGQPLFETGKESFDLISQPSDSRSVSEPWTDYSDAGKVSDCSWWEGTPQEMVIEYSPTSAQHEPDAHEQLSSDWSTDTTEAARGRETVGDDSDNHGRSRDDGYGPDAASGGVEARADESPQYSGGYPDDDQGQNDPLSEGDVGHVAEGLSGEAERTSLEDAAGQERNEFDSRDTFEQIADGRAEPLLPEDRDKETTSIRLEEWQALMSFLKGLAGGNTEVHGLVERMKRAIQTSGQAKAGSESVPPWRQEGFGALSAQKQASLVLGWVSLSKETRVDLTSVGQVGPEAKKALSLLARQGEHVQIDESRVGNRDNQRLLGDSRNDGARSKFRQVVGKDLKGMSKGASAEVGSMSMNRQESADADKAIEIQMDRSSLKNQLFNGQERRQGGFKGEGMNSEEGKEDAHFVDTIRTRTLKDGTAADQIRNTRTNSARNDAVAGGERNVETVGTEAIGKDTTRFSSAVKADTELREGLSNRVTAAGKFSEGQRPGADQFGFRQDAKAKDSHGEAASNDRAAGSFFRAAAKTGELSGQITQTMADVKADAGTEAGQKTRSMAQSASKPSSNEILAQLEKGVFRDLGQGKRQLVLRLQPEDLGTIRVVLQVKGKEIQAVMHTSNTDTATALSDQMQALRQNLEQQGLRVSRLDVQSEANHHDSAGEWTGAQGHNELQEEVARQARKMRWQGLFQRGGQDVVREMQSPGMAESFSSDGLDIFA
ncbi:MAG: flagellar hook-length control protein FliK [Deltaproteobacteria bacterium]|nr:flagellar hook-length control protein FliK [Deltaproteobacteria bacterium]